MSSLFHDHPNDILKFFEILSSQPISFGLPFIELHQKGLQVIRFGWRGRIPYTCSEQAGSSGSNICRVVFKKWNSQNCCDKSFKWKYGGMSVIVIQNFLKHVIQS